MPQVVLSAGRRAKRALNFALIAVFMIGLSQLAAADNVTWISGDGFWTVGTWSPHEPGGLDVAFINDDSNVAVTVTLDESTFVGGLVLQHDDTLRILAGGNAVALTIATNFTNDGHLVLDSTGDFAWLNLPNRSLINSATAKLTFDSGGTNFRYFTGFLSNFGEVNVNHNTIFDQSDGVHDNFGTFNIGAGSTLNTIGTIRQEDGAFNVEGTLNLQNGIFLQNGGSLDVDSTGLIHNGRFEYVGGNIVGEARLQSSTLVTSLSASNAATFLLQSFNTLDSDIGANHTLKLEGGASQSVLTSNSSFTNNGTILLTAAELGSYAWINMSAITITNSSTGKIHFDTGGSDVRYFTTDLINHGEVQIDHTTFFDNPTGDYSNYATLNLAAGVTLNVSSGTIHQQDGTFDLDGTVNLSGANLVVSGGNLDFDADAIINGGTFQYAGGTITGPVRLANSATLVLDAAATNAATFLLNGDNSLASDIGSAHEVVVESGTATSKLTSSESQITNNGTLVLKSGAAYAWLNIPNSTLTNSATGVLSFETTDLSLSFFTGDLINDGMLNVETHTHFDKLGGQYTNNGTIVVASGATLEVADGTLTNLSGDTLTGGTYDIAGTMRLPGADIRVNQAEIILRGAGSEILNRDNSVDALALLESNGTMGKLRLLDNRDFSIVGGFGFNNGGVLELGGGTFNVTPLENFASGEIFGFGTVVPRPINHGTIRAAGGTLLLLNGIEGGSGTVQVDPGATLDLSESVVDSNADNLVHNGASLDLGDADFLVANDYQNANFDTGNAFDHRANVTGTGQINADPGTTQTVSGDVTGGNTATPTLAFGNVHVGSMTTKNYQINNVDASGPKLRGAVQTSVNGGNLTDSRLTGAGVTAGNFGPLDAGSSTANLAVTYNAATAGSLSGQSVYITNNFDNVADQTLSITGAAYRLAHATAHSPEPINFGYLHVGDPAPSQSLSITNNVPDDGFSEKLNASIGSPTGGVTTNGGSFSLLTPGATNNSGLAVGISTATAGVKTGTATISLTSDGTGTSGLGQTALASQTVNVTGQVNQYAVADVLKVGGDGVFTQTGPQTFSLNFGTMLLGDSPKEAELGVLNDVLGTADTLAGSFSQSAPDYGFSGFGPFSNLAAGSTHDGLLVEINPTNVGSFNGQITLSPQSTNPNPFSMNLPAITINLFAQVRLAGDFNLDDRVDALDYVVWRINNLPAGDYDAWRGNYGDSAPGGSSGSGAAVPEPGSLILAVMALLAAIGGRVRRSMVAEFARIQIPRK